MSRSPDGRFEILYSTKSDDSYFYSDTDESWAVRILATGDELVSFHGSESGGRDGWTYRGVKSVDWSPAGDAVIATHHDGKVETAEVPTSVAIVDLGFAIELVWPDGRRERRKRSAVLFTTKYGQPHGPDLVNEPEDDEARETIPSPDGKREILHVVTRDPWRLDSAIEHTWTVRVAGTGDELAAFRGSWSGRGSEIRKDGVERVAWSPAGEAVVATRWDGAVETVAV